MAAANRRSPLFASAETAIGQSRGPPSLAEVRRWRTQFAARWQARFRRRCLEDDRCALCAGNRGLWRKAKALSRQEFVIVGWSDPEVSRPYLGALLLGYYADGGKLIYSGRVSTGMPVKVLASECFPAPQYALWLANGSVARPLG
jgi:hypothetical protein